jgi:2',3'-cyclic-nucleotide 2'-phosphodiesterase / 3'-nucleotidase
MVAGTGGKGNLTRRTASQHHAGTGAGALLDLRILATTDLHAHLMPYDYFNDAPSDAVGLLRTAGLIRVARAEMPGALLFDNGDLLQGSPKADSLAEAGKIGTARLHPMIAAMNALGYDAATLGNHDFNFGLPFLEQAIGTAAFPFVLANVQRVADPSGGSRAFLPPHVLLNRSFPDRSGQLRALRIGVIGFVPPQIMRWDRDFLDGRLVAEDIVTSARRLVPALRRAGADLVVALCHTGIGGTEMQDSMEDAAIPTARIAGIDVLILGHSHLVFPSAAFTDWPETDWRSGTVAGTPAVMAGAMGSHLGVVDLTLAQTADGWAVRSSTVAARPIAQRMSDGTVMPLVIDDPALHGIATGAHLSALTYVRRPVGRSEVGLHSYFSLLHQDRTLSLIADAQRAAVVAALTMRGQSGTAPLLSAVAPLKSGGRSGPSHYVDIPPGALAVRNCADLYPFPNSIRAVSATGAQLAEWLERSAAIYRRILPGIPDQPLIDPDHPSYNFDVLDGLTYAIDLTVPARYDPHGRIINPGAWRISDLRHNGIPVRPDQRFIVATNSYRVQGGGDFPVLAETEVIYEAPVANREVIVRHIAGQIGLRPEPRATWRFAPIPGATVLFRTGPSAELHLADIAHLAPTVIGTDSEGYLELRLTL